MRDGIPDHEETLISTLPDSPNANGDLSPTEAEPQNSLLRLSIERYVDHSMAAYAAAVSFWSMISLVPLMAMVVFGVALFVEAATVESFLEEVSTAVPGETVRLLTDVVQAWVEVSDEVSGFGLVIAVIVAAWWASAGMSNLMKAISGAHQVPPRTYVRRRLAALGRTVGALLFVIPIVTLVAATPAALATAGISTWLRWTLGIVRWPVATLLLVSGIGALYRVAPSSRLTTRFFTRGVAVAVLGALFASAAFSLYVANVDRYDASYGSLGTVVVTMLWIYGTTSAILFGAEVDAARNARAAPPRASS